MRVIFIGLGEQQTFEPGQIKDEYFENFTHSESDFTQDMFTSDFYEYEQGQKDILVKGRLKQNIEFWKSIVSDKNDFIIDIILNGYKIPFYSEPEGCILANNKSAKSESKFVTEAICDLLKRGLVEKCIDIAYVVNPLTVSVQNNNKKRLILDLRNVNKHVWKQSIKYEDLRIALLFKFDLKSAYHFVDIYPPHTKYLGFSWPNEDGVVEYFKSLSHPYPSSKYMIVLLPSPLHFPINGLVIFVYM